MIEQLKEMILPFRIMNIVDNLTPNNIQSFLFHGEQGVGKSLTARLLSEKLKMPTINLDLSAKGGRGVDSLEDIRVFIDQKTTLRKIIIINEVDNLSSKALETLKNLMDEYCVPDNNKAVFLLTTNHINKLENAISTSRCEAINFNIKTDEKKEIYQKSTLACYDMLKKTGIEIDDHIKDSIKVLLTNTLPDYRAMTNTLELAINIHKEGGKLELNFSGFSSPTIVAREMLNFFKKKDFKGFIPWYKSNVTFKHKEAIDKFLCMAETSKDLHSNEDIYNKNMSLIYFHASVYIHRIDTGHTPDIHLISFLGSIIGGTNG